MLCILHMTLHRDLREITSGFLFKRDCAGITRVALRALTGVLWQSRYD